MGEKVGDLPIMPVDVLPIWQYPNVFTHREKYVINVAPQTVQYYC